MMSSELTEHNAQDSLEWELPDDEARLMSDSARLVVGFDGKKPCRSLLLTSELVRNVNRISILARKQKQISDAAHQASQEAHNTETEVHDLEESLVSTRTRLQSRPIKQRLDIARAGLTAARGRHAEVEGECRILERDLTLEREKLENIIETAFDQINLLGRAAKSSPPSEVAAAEPADSSNDGANDASHSSKKGTPSRMEEKEGSFRSQERPEPSPHPSSVDEVFDMQERLQKWLNAHNRAEYIFENRKNVEQENIEQRKYHISIGLPRESRTEFDLRHVEREIELTRQLITVTQGLERIKEVARQYGIFTPSEQFERGINEWDAPGYYTEPSEGSPEDETPEEDPEMNARIERWQQGAGSAGFGLENETRMDVDLDEWDAETVRMSESGSMIDESSRRAKIDEWREMCGLHDGH